ncbi:hypothetical protein M0M57_00575 [Flavobacterium azooxidireducens]|uniref:Uncharacterized protein n=1 Tax=Flavobacterium azooxidireducens TaxID=1871076 RepID=A0ABY4KHU8_9FLAO|nr:hypothetical protein [Flavobacterium azooxidireducens]UPQ79348.1 hypothetical protein M0M57_00575 [Flavobacterium azooxidireducens]
MYFRKVTIPELNSDKIERNIRLFTLKRHTSLDLKSGSTYIAEPNKFFLGFENNTQIDLLRITTPFERLLPKLIVSFNKSNFKEYKVRLQLLSMILIVVLSAGLLMTIYHSIKSKNLESDFLFILSLNLIFYLLAFVEYKFVTKKIERVINSA